MTFLLMTNAFDFGAIFKTVVTRWYYYLFLGVFLAALVLFFVFKKLPERNNLTKTQKISYASVLTALCVLANIFDVKVSDALQLSFVATTGFLAGYLLGGGYGFAVCFLGDLIGAIINPHGAYNPVIGVGTGLWGLVPGLVFTSRRGNGQLRLLISFAICSVLVSGLVNTFGIYLMYGLGKKTFAAYLVDYPIKLIAAAANYVVSAALLAVLPKILPKNKFGLVAAGEKGFSGEAATGESAGKEDDKKNDKKSGEL